MTIKGHRSIRARLILRPLLACAIGAGLLWAAALSVASAQDEPRSEAEILALLLQEAPRQSPAQEALFQLNRADASRSSAARVAALTAALEALGSIPPSDYPAELPPRAVLLERLAAAHLAAGNARAALAALRDAQRAWEQIYGAPDVDGAPAPLADAYARLADVAEQAGDSAYAEQLRRLGARTKSLAVRSLGAGSGAAEVTLFYATSRQVEPLGADGRQNVRDFKGQPKPDGQALSYGRMSVSVPHDLDVGEVRKPQLWRLELRPDPKKHIIITDIAPIRDEDSFFAAARRFLDGDGDMANASTLREAVVYIHGYQNTFEAAARRAAKLAYDLRVDGVPFLYSWASQGDPTSYYVDRFRCDDVAVKRFADFLDGVVRRSGAERVHVIAHSMGNCLTVKALDGLAAGIYAQGRTWTSPSVSSPPLDQVVLAAADLTRREFNAGRVQRIRPLSNGMTVYASDRDWALKAADLITAQDRVGEVRPLLERRGVEVVDASEAPSDIFNHMHFAAGALDDLRALLWSGAGVDRRCLLDRRQTPARYRHGRPLCDAVAVRLAADALRQWEPATALHTYCRALSVRQTPGTTRERVCAQVQALSGVRWREP